MAATETICRHCAVRNRISSTAGTKALRCGKCGNPLATPAILGRLESVRDELIALESAFSRYALPGKHAELEQKLRRQQKILRNLPILPGYNLTISASFDLYVEIEFRAEELSRRLETNIFKLAKRIVEELLDFIKKSGGPQQLMPGG